ncbi:hypothetical protein FF80_00873 [Devosia sp. LC5]|nr:hypothetical protein FF80_00873 [Devosia sp. LC5]
MIIERHSSLSDAIEVLRSYRDAGVPADRVYDLLRLILEDGDERPGHDDFVREIMDIVIGYCSPHNLRVWD